ncbi:MAG TPA: hypothetical protein DF364_06910 [Ruminococcaceae bacterium]|nr:hypothetical protein [Oscillospiraceae bacterium]HCU33554.1 hypothetical protein [Oscillospiraceae bacterium]
MKRVQRQKKGRPRRTPAAGGFAGALSNATGIKGSRTTSNSISAAFLFMRAKKIAKLFCEKYCKAQQTMLR